ncbi:hypothetical protein U1Q18_013318 [Sarracenia purpurea var. burkii]
MVELQNRGRVGLALFHCFWPHYSGGFCLPGLVDSCGGGFCCSEVGLVGYWYICCWQLHVLAAADGLFVLLTFAVGGLIVAVGFVAQISFKVGCSTAICVILPSLANAAQLEA